ncbi:hypothetical protein B0H13DRAFT_2478662 [Mycena leptocephala]|nr:hypothetical protein B0H13DRAFT_2478662 [Mycena leptocephala]
MKDDGGCLGSEKKWMGNTGNIEILRTREAGKETHLIPSRQPTLPADALVRSVGRGKGGEKEKQKKKREKDGGGSAETQKRELAHEAQHAPPEFPNRKSVDRRMGVRVGGVVRRRARGAVRRLEEHGVEVVRRHAWGPVPMCCVSPSFSPVTIAIAGGARGSAAVQASGGGCCVSLGARRRRRLGGGVKRRRRWGSGRGWARRGRGGGSMLGRCGTRGGRRGRGERKREKEEKKRRKRKGKEKRATTEEGGRARRKEKKAVCGRRWSGGREWRRRRTGVGEGGVEEGRDRDMRSRRTRGEAVEGKRGREWRKGMEGSEDKANEEGKSAVEDGIGKGMGVQRTKGVDERWGGEEGGRDEDEKSKLPSLGLRLPVAAAEAAGNGGNTNPPNASLVARLLLSWCDDAWCSPEGGGILYPDPPPPRHTYTPHPHPSSPTCIPSSAGIPRRRRSRHRHVHQHQPSPALPHDAPEPRARIGGARFDDAEVGVELGPVGGDGCEAGEGVVARGLGGGGAVVEGEEEGEGAGGEGLCRIRIRIRIWCGGGFWRGGGGGSSGLGRFRRSGHGSIDAGSRRDRRIARARARPELVGLSSPSFPPSFPPSLLGFVSAAVVAAPEVEAADNVAATAPKVPNKRSTRSARRFCAASSSRRASTSPKAPARRAARWVEVVRVPGRGVVVVVGKVEEEEVGKVEAEEEAGSVDEDVAVEGAASLAALSTTARTTAGMATCNRSALDTGHGRGVTHRLVRVTGLGGGKSKKCGRQGKRSSKRRRSAECSAAHRQSAGGSLKPSTTRLQLFTYRRRRTHLVVFWAGTQAGEQEQKAEQKEAVPLGQSGRFIALTDVKRSAPLCHALPVWAGNHAAQTNGTWRGSIRLNRTHQGITELVRSGSTPDLFVGHRSYSAPAPLPLPTSYLPTLSPFSLLRHSKLAQKHRAPRGPSPPSIPNLIQSRPSVFLRQRLVMHHPAPPSRLMFAVAPPSRITVPMPTPPRFLAP